MKIFKKNMALAFALVLTVSLIPNSTLTYGAGHTHTKACYPGGTAGTVGLHVHWGNTDGIYRSSSSDYTEQHGCYTAYYTASYWDSDWDTCSSCGGSGSLDVTCSSCGGSGSKSCPTCGGAGSVSCSLCGGSGKVGGKSTCSTCGGSGSVEVGCTSCDSAISGSTVTGGGSAGDGVCDWCGGGGTFNGKTCPGCGGSGVCSACGGSGVISSTCSTCHGSGETGSEVTCAHCGGNGSVSCGSCSGTGSIDCTNCTGGISGTRTCDNCYGTGEYDYGHTVRASIRYSSNTVCGLQAGSWANGQVRKKVNGHYDGALVACVCDKVATNITPSDSAQYLEIGESPDLTGTATFLNGTTNTAITASGYTDPLTDPSKYNVAQTVTLSAGEYHTNADNAGPLTKTITVYVNGYRRVDTSVNNSLYGKLTVSGTSGNGKSYTCDGVTHAYDGLWQAGRSTTITATPNTGYMLLSVTDSAGNLVIDCGTGSTSAKTYTFTMPDGDTSFYATFAPRSVTATFKLDGGNINGSTASFTKTYTYGNAYGNLTNPVKEGYIFNGWLSSKTDTVISTYSTVPYTNHTLTATWLPVTGTTYSIAYDDYYINPAVLNKTGYTPYDVDSANEWVMTELYNNGNPYLSTLTCAVCHETITNLITSLPKVRMVVPYSHTVYKAWTPNTHTVTFDANGGTLTSTVTSITDASSFTESAGIYTPTGHAVLVDSSTATKTVMYDMRYGILPTPTAPDGKYFYGWGTSKDILHASIVTASSLVKLTGDQTLYALFTVTPVTPPTETHEDMIITYDPNGGTGSYKDTFLDVK